MSSSAEKGVEEKVPGPAKTENSFQSNLCMKHHLCLPR